MSWDRLKEAARSLQNLDPLHSYRRMYKAKVVSQSSTTPDQVDVRPFDARLPDMAGVTLRHGVPGMHVLVQLGCTVLVGWEDGKPDQPFAALWGSDTVVARVEFNGQTIALGGEIEAPIYGTTFISLLQAFLSALSGSIDPALVAAAATLNAALGPGGASVLSSKVTIG